MVFGLKMFGGLGDGDRWITGGVDVTQRYLLPNVLVQVSGTWMVRLRGAVGLTDVSQDLAK